MQTAYAINSDPYWCAQGVPAYATGQCMSRPQNVDVNVLTTQTTKWSSSGAIDPTYNMYNDRIFIYNGKLDTVVDPGIGLGPVV